MLFEKGSFGQVSLILVTFNILSKFPYILVCTFIFIFVKHYFIHSFILNLIFFICLFVLLF